MADSVATVGAGAFPLAELPGLEVETVRSLPGVQLGLDDALAVAVGLLVVADAVLRIRAGELETLTPIRLRYSGDLQDLTAARDDQDVLRTEVQTVNNKIINTTVGRVIFNEALPKEMPFINGLMKKKGLQSLVTFCHLKLGHDATVVMLDDHGDVLHSATASRYTSSSVVAYLLSRKGW